MPRKKEPDASLPALTQTYAMKAEAEFLPTVAQSLLESCRMSLPPGDEPADLVAISVKCPGLYATFLGKIMAGSSFRAAALSVGLSPDKMRHWLAQGSADLADDEDSYCSRLLLDYQRAASISVSDAEERVHRADPSKWLSRSPTGKQFNKGTYWLEQAKPGSDDIPEDHDELDPAPLRTTAEQIADNDDGELELSEAMKVLEGYQIATDPEFIKQAKTQFRLTDGRKDE